jgi:hypothetical protein
VFTKGCGDVPAGLAETFKCRRECRRDTEYSKDEGHCGNEGWVPYPQNEGEETEIGKQPTIRREKSVVL